MHCANHRVEHTGAGCDSTATEKRGAGGGIPEWQRPADDHEGPPKPPGQRPGDGEGYGHGPGGHGPQTNGTRPHGPPDDENPPDKGHGAHPPYGYPNGTTPHPPSPTGVPGGSTGTPDTSDTPDTPDTPDDEQPPNKGHGHHPPYGYPNGTAPHPPSPTGPPGGSSTGTPGEHGPGGHGPGGHAPPPPAPENDGEGYETTDAPEKRHGGPLIVGGPIPLPTPSAYDNEGRERRFEDDGLELEHRAHGPLGIPIPDEGGEGN
jgi:hypothetical protein